MSFGESLPLLLQLLSKHIHLTDSPLPAIKHDENPTPLPWTYRLVCSALPYESVQMLPCIRKVRACDTLLIGRDQSYQCFQFLLATSTASTRPASLKFPSPSGLHASRGQLWYPPHLRAATSVSEQTALTSRFKDHTCLRSVIVLLQTLPFNSKLQFQLRFFDNTTLECFTTLSDTCTNRSTRDLNARFSRFVETDTTLDTVMHVLTHDLVHPDRQDKHKIRYCLRQIFDAWVGVSLLECSQAPSLSASALSLDKAFPLMLLKMLVLLRKFEKLLLCVTYTSGELRLQDLDHFFCICSGCARLNSCKSSLAATWTPSTWVCRRCPCLCHWTSALHNWISFAEWSWSVRSQLSVLNDPLLFWDRSTGRIMSLQPVELLTSPQIVQKITAHIHTLQLCNFNDLCVCLCHWTLTLHLQELDWFRRCDCSKLLCVAFNMCAGNIHLSNTCFIVFRLSVLLLDFRDWMLLIVVSPGSHPRTASFPPRGHPCARWSDVSFPPWIERRVKGKS